MKRHKGEERKIARERIDILMQLADDESARGLDERANRYAELARRIGMRYNVPLSRAQKRRVCGHCGRYLRPGKGASVRIGGGKVTVRCLACGGISRYPYVKEQKRRREVGRKDAERA